MLNLLINGFLVSIFDPDIASNKSSQVGKWHLIVDLSSPVGESVVEPKLCSLSYLQLDEVINNIAEVGQEHS